MGKKLEKKLKKKLKPIKKRLKIICDNVLNITALLEKADEILKEQGL